MAKATVCVGKGSLQTESVWPTKGRIRILNPTVHAPASSFKFQGIVGSYQQPCWTCQKAGCIHLRQGNSSSSHLIHGSLLGGALIFHDLLSNNWVERGLNCASSSEEAWCLHRMPSDNRQQVDTSPRGACRLLPNGGNINTGRGRGEVQSLT